MTLLESYAREYWISERKYIAKKKPALKKIVHKLLVSNTPFANRALYELMMLAEKDDKNKDQDNPPPTEPKKDKYATIMSDIVNQDEKTRKEVEKVFTNNLATLKTLPISELLHEYDNVVARLIRVGGIGNEKALKAKALQGVYNELLERNKRTDLTKEEKKALKEALANVKKSILELKDESKQKTEVVEKANGFFAKVGGFFKQAWNDFKASLKKWYMIGLYGLVLAILVFIAVISAKKYGIGSGIVTFIVGLVASALAGFALYSLVRGLMAIFKKKETVPATGKYYF